MILESWFIGLGVMLALGTLTWLVSLVTRDVSIVDSLWSLMFLAGAGVYLYSAETIDARSTLVFALVAIWALRLSIFLTVRNWGQEEDRRYRDIRANNQPYFAFKSLFIIFGLQAVLAWFISVPLHAGLSASGGFSLIDGLALLLWLTGFVIEAVADMQLYRFKKQPANTGQVLDSGLWRYSRHPNYFGESLIWWAFYLFAVEAGAWWIIAAPVLMTLLLLKVSGVALMEKDISERRAAYRDYIDRTNAFIPGIPREKTAGAATGQGGAST